MAKLKKAPQPIADKQPLENPLPPQPPHAHRAGRYAFRLVLLAALGAVAYGLWKNPVALDKVRAHFDAGQEGYGAQISSLQAQVASLTEELAKAHFKLDNSGFTEVKDQMRKLEQMNLNVINSKADASTVLGVVTRLDSAEQKIANLSAVTDSSALILTGVLLVKDAADRGQTFEYETEVLTQIAKENPRAERHIQKLQPFAATGILTDIELAAEFNQFYNLATTSKEEPADQTWKERLNNKLGEIVQISKTDAPVVHNPTEQALKDAHNLVQNNEILRASKGLEKLTEPEIMNNQAIQNWITKVNQREEFYKAISALSADALAALKVNNLHKLRPSK